MASVKEHAIRVVILIAAAGFILSSVGVTIAYFMQNKEQNEQQKLTQELQQQQGQNQTPELTPALPLTGYSAEPFDKTAVTELKVEILKEGDGAEANGQSTVKANYFGWTADGKIFDSSQKSADVAEPIEFSLTGVITGWTEGLTGVKSGSTVKLLIPSDKAYGAQGSPPNIGPNEPLSFIVELVEVK